VLGVHQQQLELIADLLQHGLLRASFVPPVEIRRLRDLTRMRTKIRQTLASFANRIQKVLEDANIKLGSVASDVCQESPDGTCSTLGWRAIKTRKSWRT
jgi:transposase